MGEGDRAYRSGSPTGAGSRDVPHAWWRKRRARPAALRQRRSQAHRREIAERARDGKEQYDPGERLIPRHGVAAMMWKSWTESSPLGIGLGEEITPQELAYGGAPSRCGDGLYRMRVRRRKGSDRRRCASTGVARRGGEKETAEESGSSASARGYAWKPERGHASLPLGCKSHTQVGSNDAPHCLISSFSSHFVLAGTLDASYPCQELPRITEKLTYPAPRSCQRWGLCQSAKWSFPSVSTNQ